MKKIFSLLVLFVSVAAAAGTPGWPDSGKTWPFRQEVRFGIGDMLFETMVWHDQVHGNYMNFPDGSEAAENRDYSYTPHVSIEYMWHFLPWLSAGLNVDIQNTSWKLNTYDNSNRLLSSSPQNFFNLCLMPTVRFNYFRRQHIGLYSSLGAGVDFNGGSETDYRGRHTAVGAACDLRFIGLTAGNGHWWGFFDFGGMFAMQNKDVMFLMGSQLMRTGVSYRF